MRGKRYSKDDFSFEDDYFMGVAHPTGAEAVFRASNLWA